ncbi:hypothetical protein GCM10010981_32940 [Dyella nitratireducens]|uniref:Transposase n=1 Tax=Dyella nitratireducens TaxID=1849580 RepID=A0ABQ1GCS5_9GAMM|nr:hypothetical protein GCM10010981_32940 [Dyella nitratireducens]GLQ40652.1 hypothetical protein GCM10007902_05010 [Dyella nitratireducens]
MGVMDHTARACPSKPFWLIEESQLPPDPEQARRYIQLMSIAGTSLAMCVIRNLLRCDRVARRPKPAHRPADVDARPLSPTQVEGLRAALYFLRQYGDGLLQAERDG